MESNEIIKINTIEEYTELFGCGAAKQPLLNINRLTDVREYIPIGKPVQLNLYSMTIKDGSACNNSKYGWREYDFKKGAMSFFPPGQIHSWDEKTENADRWGWTLTFHPDFIRKYPLGEKIDKLKFFSYETNEALHISDAERTIIEGIMENIETEYKRSIDEHSQDIIVSQLDVLLNYSERFYTRQFRTRDSVESDVLTRFQSMLHKHFEKNKGNLITANDIASELAMSTHYLSDFLRNLTGLNTQQHIHSYVIERAKGLLLNTNLSVNEIAFSLGFEYPQYFSRLFKSKTGQTPIEFRNMNLKKISMKKIILSLLTVISLLTACNNNVRKGHYNGQDISAQAEIMKNIETKTTQIHINLNSPWQLYAGISVDSIDFSNPVASSDANGIFPVETPFYPRQYFQLTSSGKDALFAERHLPMEGGYNFRDVGGYPTTDGRFVKWGMVFRTDDMQHLTQADLDYLTSLDVRTVVDFRSEEEVAAGADKLPSTTSNHILLPVIPGNLSAFDALQLDSASIYNMMESLYISLCTEDKIINQYRQFFALLQNETKIPLSFHCSAGKDRTGMGAALFLYSLGVCEDVIIQDYLLSNKYLENKYTDLIAQRPEMKLMVTVKPEYLKTALKRIMTDHGSIEKYLEKTLNVDLEKMRRIYLY